MPEAPIVNEINKPLTPVPPVKTFTPSLTSLIIVAVLIIAAGSATGYFLSRKSLSNSPTSVSAGKDAIQTANEIGSTDTKTFSDTATGILEKGGSNGEGTHKLIRDGGPSQTVYLISSIVDLDEYVGKKMQIFGQTIDAQKVGWLMDVGRLKLLE
jgi:hypothetical protein